MVNIVEKYREYKKEKEAYDEAQEMLADKDLKELAVSLEKNISFSIF